MDKTLRDIFDNLPQRYKDKIYEIVGMIVGNELTAEEGYSKAINELPRLTIEERELIKYLCEEAGKEEQ